MQPPTCRGWDGAGYQQRLLRCGCITESVAGDLRLAWQQRVSFVVLRAKLSWKDFSSYLRLRPESTMKRGECGVMHEAWSFSTPSHRKKEVFLPHISYLEEVLLFCFLICSGRGPDAPQGASWDAHACNPREVMGRSVLIWTIFAGYGPT